MYLVNTCSVFKVDLLTEKITKDVSKHQKYTQVGNKVLRQGMYADFGGGWDEGTVLESPSNCFDLQYYNDEHVWIPGRHWEKNNRN